MLILLRKKSIDMAFVIFVSDTTESCSCFGQAGMVIGLFKPSQYIDPILKHIFRKKMQFIRVKWNTTARLVYYARGILFIKQSNIKTQKRCFA